MKAKEIREKSISELQEEIKGLLREQFNLRMQKGSGHKVKEHLFGRVKKNIARIKTIIGEKIRQEG
jgi:large subunit ribosomal protein L29